MNSDPLFQLGLWGLTALSLLGTALNVKKRIACFYLWAVVNVAWVFVDCHQGLWARSALDGGPLRLRGVGDLRLDETSAEVIPHSAVRSLK